MSPDNPLLPAKAAKPAAVPAGRAEVPVSPAAGARAILDPMKLRAATSVADMPDGVGSVVAAVVAPKEGAINVRPGTPVVLVAKRFWDSPTIKKLRNAMALAWGAFAGYVVFNVLISGGPFELTAAQWLALLRDGTYPALLTVAGVYGISLKVKDNDPVVTGSPPKGPGA